MSTGAIIEVAVGVALLAAAVWLYRKGAREDANYGSQGAVLLFVIAVIVAIHGLGWMEYHPSASELETYEGMRSLTH